MRPLGTGGRVKSESPGAPPDPGLGVEGAVCVCVCVCVCLCLYV